MSNKDVYAVIGSPIKHSKSPWIHTLFAEVTQEPVEYKAVLGNEQDFAGSVDAFRAEGGLGLNVTVPFKQDAFNYATEHSERAKRAGAVNTLVFREDGSVLADNTDGVGIVRDITKNHGFNIQGQRVLILGAGGAVRGILEPLLSEQPSAVVIANRTVSKAEELAQDFADLGSVSACGFVDVEGAFDLIINGTSASLSGELPPVPETVIQSSTVCYDMMYGAEMTVFNQWAQKQGASQVIDGLGMLVEQAAESFFIWRGVRPDTTPVLTALRDSLKQG
ncbi:shikimate dehydrogenase [Litoribrevibacter albus]|uniref:Shikimate dehydrogenase (NADP(+)) n=1 Tax=Litoribrevibacter albus TaxID=1473156 RepID=A0AA37W980_9GAMM|nr:shikimate dehydrogenase [Litoribrevibacter albus]GLQ32939.1 shikimate dehydrogenase (NADP(+)) [Litoribrevibacter albus]